MVEFKKNWRELIPYQSQLQNIKSIEERNEKFNSLPKADRRMEIALDSLGLLEMEIIGPSNGLYWSSSLYELVTQDNPVVDPHDMQYNALNLKPKLGCYVCARGAMMLSTIRVGNGLPNNTMIDCGDEDNQKHFTNRMFYMMEDTYESSSRPYRHNSRESLINIFAQVAFTGKFSSANGEYLTRIADIIEEDW